MINIKNKSKVLAIAFVLSLTTTSMLLPFVLAQDKEPSFAYVYTSPSGVVQVNQPMIIGAFVQPPPAFERNFNYNFVITDPNGHNETQLIPESLVDGTAGFTYTPTIIGTYSVVMSWQGDEVREAVTSLPTTFDVQEEAIEYPQYPESLPDYRWSFPINSIYRSWSEIAGAWPMNKYDRMGSNFNPYTLGPNTPHILWTKPMYDQGIIGGAAGQLSQMRGAKAMATPRLIGIQPVAASGRLFWVQGYRDPDTANLWDGDRYQGDYHSKLYCFDMYTGEQLWEVELPGTSSSSPTIYIEQEDMKIQTTRRTVTGFRFVLWVVGGGIWEVEPFDGRLIQKLNATSGTYASIPDANRGALFLTNFNGTANDQESGVMTRWDTEFNEPVWVNEGVPNPTFIYEDMLVQAQSSNSLGVRVRTWNATTGEPILTGPYTGVYRPTSAHVVGDGKYFYHGADLRTRAISLTTGEVLWTSDPFVPPWGAFGTYTASYAYGNLYMPGHDGYLRCFDGETGDLKWDFYTGYTPENAFGTFPLFGNQIIADGKVYFATSPHTLNNPVPIGYHLYALDAETGDPVWTYEHFVNRDYAGISAGMLWLQNHLDGQMYMFGKGETKTMVTAPTTSVPLGTGVLIQGTVMDQSSGAMDTPAIADEYMSEWMQHIYNNAPAPMDATGVQVLLRALSSNGTMTEIGTVTSDSLGHYETTWTPTDQGTYKIIASFIGSDSYYSSSGETGLSVGPAPATGGGIEPEAQAPLMTTEIAILIAVVVIAAVALLAYWILKKRK